MRLKFTKMHGLGNDFMVVDLVTQHLDARGRDRFFAPANIRRLADRHFGIGFDQLLVVEPPSTPAADFRYRIFNADGGEVEQCGNGARCFARFVLDHGLTERRTIRVETLGGIIEPSIEDDGRVRVGMGRPAFGPPAVGFDADGLESSRRGDDETWSIDAAGVPRPISLVSVGNPHAVQFVDDVDRAPVDEEGPRIGRSPRFARGANVGFVQVVSPQALRLRVWERGVGETLACGTGACAAALAAIRQGRVRSPVDVRTRGGTLRIDWDGSNLTLTGPARTVFEGEIDCAALFETEGE